jgi:hypothetical protein
MKRTALEFDVLEPYSSRSTLRSEGNSFIQSSATATVATPLKARSGCVYP